MLQVWNSKGVLGALAFFSLIMTHLDFLTQSTPQTACSRPTACTWQILSVISAHLLFRLGTGRTGELKSWILKQWFLPPRCSRVRIMPGQYVCVWVVNCLCVRMQREGGQWEEFISILVVTCLCSETSTWNKEEPHRGALLCKKALWHSQLFSVLVAKPSQTAIPQDTPSQILSKEKLLTRHDPSVAHHPHGASTPGVFPPAWTAFLLKSELLISHPTCSRHREMTPFLLRALADVCRGGLLFYLGISEHPQFFQTILRGSHFEEDPAKLLSKRDASKHTNKNSICL